MSSKSLWIIGGVILAIILITVTVLFLRLRDTGTPLYNPFQPAQTMQSSEIEVYDPPSDFSSPSIPDDLERLPPAEPPSNPEPLMWPPPAGY